MNSLRQALESTVQAEPLLREWGVRDGARGWRNLKRLEQVAGFELLERLASMLAAWLPNNSDPDLALNGLQRVLDNPKRVSLLDRLLSEPELLHILLQLLATSDSFGDRLAAHPEDVEMLRLPLRHNPSAEELRNELKRLVEAAETDDALLRAFRRFRQRHNLRIGAKDVIGARPLEEVTRSLSAVADASLCVAWEAAWRRVALRFGQPCGSDGGAAVGVVLAFGKLGGEELNYSSDVDLMFVYDAEGVTQGGRSSVGNEEFFGRVVGELVRLLSAHTDHGHAYRVDLRLRPEGERGPLARSLDSTLSYYENLGRTWERQALIKLRPVAGDQALGQKFLLALEPFIYRKYLTFTEINDIRALKRKVERQADRTGGSDSDVKSGRGGIRDIEFAIQFLQLLNGTDLPDVRQRNTLAALRALERAGCLTDQESRILDDAYRFLRQVEHRLQLLFDLQTHRLPASPDELNRLARRLGYPAGDDSSEAPRILFRNDLCAKTELDRKILDHLLHQAFGDEGGAAEPESDLVLDPRPDPSTVQAVLGRYGFRDVPAAYRNLSELARESVPFLSTRRCRHFLAAIGPRLLRAVAETPDPDMALVNLEKVTASLGAKSVLWELFSFNPPSLRLYVDLCAGSQFLADLLINNPGMIDELLDSLVLNRPRPAMELRTELAELCRGPADPMPILHSFRDKELLRIGVADILGKASVRQTTAALSDLAEVVLRQIFGLEEEALTLRLGSPHLEDGRPCGYALLALGKLGGRELGYHSDLDLMLIYEADGATRARDREAVLTDNFHFYSELARRAINAAGTAGPMGRLYTVDMRLRPTGRSGSLVLPLREFTRYYADGGAHLWERQALTRARIVHGQSAFAMQVEESVARACYQSSRQPGWAERIRTMRARLEASRGARDLKRGVGGTVDVEFAVQMLQLKHGPHAAELRVPNIWEALDALRRLGIIDSDIYDYLRRGYDFLRFVECRLRIVHNRLQEELPQGAELETLARRLGFTADVSLSARARLEIELERQTTRIRQAFLRVVELAEH